MNRLSLSILLLLSAACLILACGSGSNRQLQSITIHSSVSSEQVQFTATGTFSSAPTTVNPLPVSWSFAPPPGEYTLTTQPFVFNCAQPPAPGPIVACAPTNASAPASGRLPFAEMTCISGSIPCP
jgi:hypothetical protein